MRTDIDHLPPPMRRDLNRIVRLLFLEFDDALGAPDGQRKLGRILKIILYGRHVREDRDDALGDHESSGSNFDLLIIVNQPELTHRHRYWARAEERLLREMSITRSIGTSAAFIVHSLQDVNDCLAHGRDFMMDIAREGIALYQSDDIPLLKPKPKTPDAALRAAQAYFAEWYPSAIDYHAFAKEAAAQGKSRMAAFLFHQATEQLYRCSLLVGQLYSPNIKDLSFLRSQAERLDRRLCHIWPTGTRLERAKFDTLRNAYFKARVSMNYRVDRQELDWFAERIAELGQAVLSFSRDRIAALEAVAAGSDAGVPATSKVRCP
ncbi:nucleotidyltransferase [Sphingomonas sp. AP4-R1]|uniref:nucleotidyltransferase n=1 Tax=Sphingomonas sp. AP4-R1 TaxID=2735134 RepID=UPI001493D68A|nr:nucleotidyltransferase [Sphingomonas sp. AP4-R1]QJU56964.1 nucleotidyltransferase [Sphingomonas sp. AP4-R1]